VNFVFVGNRRFVLEEMLSKNLSLKKVYILEGSHLVHDIGQLNVTCDIVKIRKKEDLFHDLGKIDYDVLISNGCPFIFPAELLSDGKKYVNIHPSYLPDLRGIDPVIGAILYTRDSGATCHVMNARIDEGDIIARIKIPYSSDLDVRLLYQLSFLAEKQVFLEAFHRCFTTALPQEVDNSCINYKRKNEDMQITFFESCQELSNKINAFNNRSQGAFFTYNNERFRVYQTKLLKNPFLVESSKFKREREVINIYENCLIVKLSDGLVLLDQIVGDLSKLKLGMLMGNNDHVLCV
jgi:methionyl-tRNA formyltransferase